MNWAGWQAGSMRDIYPDDEKEVDIPIIKKLIIEPCLLSELDRLLEEIIEEAIDEELATFDALCISGNGE